MSNDIGLAPFQDNPVAAPDAILDAGDSTRDTLHPKLAELMAPQYTGHFTDGSEVLVIGDVAAFAEYNHRQGDNDQNCKGDCGLVSAADVLNQFGIQVTENDVVHHAIEHGECDGSSDDPEKRGQSVPDQIVQIMKDYGVAAHVEKGDDLNSLIANLQQGHSVIIAANAGYLWNDSRYLGNGDANHAITVTGVACDPKTGQMTGFFVNDSGDGQSCKFVSADLMQQAWVNAKGECIVTDAAHPDASQPPHPDASQPGHSPIPTSPAASHESGSNAPLVLSSLVMAGIGLRSLSRADRIKKQ